MSDIQNIAARVSLRALGMREARKNAVTQAVAGLILLAVGYLTATSGYGDAVGAAHPVCAVVVLAGGLLLCVQAMLVVFRALLAQYEHFAMPAEEANFSLYEFRVSGALILTGAQMLLPWRWMQSLCVLALAAILVYCAATRLRGTQWHAWRTALGGVLAALGAVAGMALAVGAFTGFSWSLGAGIAALGFAMDSFYCALESMKPTRV